MKHIYLFILAFAICTIATAQNTSYCPGLKNPATFTAGSTSGTIVGYWSGQTGSKSYISPNALTGTTGVTMSSSVISASQLSSMTSSCSGQNPDANKRFRIMSSTDGPGTGTNVGKDVHSNYNLPYCPTTLDTSIHKSIRIGNECTGGEAEALYYTMDVRPQNALLHIYYSIVVETPGHGLSGDPSFVVRVAHQNSGSTWSQISDTLCYAVSSFGVSNGVNSWHSAGSGYYTLYYRDWNTVTINLNNYLYERVRLEMYISDCAAQGHYGYCYIAGDCQRMEITQSDYTASDTTIGKRLTAPTGMTNYVWYKCNSGTEGIDSLLDVSDSINFTQLTPSTSTNNTYDCQISDFFLTEGTQAGNYTNDQIFRCDMTSAMDPAKPFTTKTYIRIQNVTPTIAIDTVKYCNSSVRLTDRSYVPGNDHGCDTSITKWFFYSGPNTNTDIADSAVGGTVVHQWDSCGIYAVRVRSYYGDDTTHFGEHTYPIHVICSPSTMLSVSSNEIDQGDSVTLTAMGAYCYGWSATPEDVSLDPLLDSLGHGPAEIIVSPMQTTVYTLVGYGTNGCSSNPLTEEITVRSTDPEAIIVPEEGVVFAAPHAFTPGLAENNTFHIYAAEEYDNFSVYIYNRMGYQVFHSNDLHFSWNGNVDNDGIQCTQGAYVWVIRYRDLKTHNIVTQKGTVTLIR